MAPEPWLAPEITVAGAEADGGCWVVTASDAAFWPWLATFFGSLREVAGYRGDAAVLDYGLRPEQLSILAAHGIERLPVAGRRSRVVDRYLSLGERFPSSSGPLVAHFDADVWFNGPIDPLFSRPDLRAGRLGAAIDVLTCDYYLRCSAPEHHPEVRRMLADVQSAFGESLQAGVVVGTGDAWRRYARALEDLLDRKVARDGWGADALALNFFARDRPDEFVLLPITYNAPPLWRFQREGRQLFADEPGGTRSSHSESERVPIHAVHRTSGVRGIESRDLPFQELHPEIAERWARAFGLESPP